MILDALADPGNDDALITLAMLAQAETSPDRLDEFATLVLQTPRALS